MKKIITYSAMAMLLGCTADTLVAPTNTVNLGVPSMQLAIKEVSSPVTTGPFSITVQVTPAASYSFQLTHINGAILHNYGFTAQSALATVNLDYSTIPEGAYDLVLVDNTGRLLKTAVIIQR